MKETLGCIRRADQDFSMIAEGDTILVGVSGGKDSLLLLYALGLYRKFSTHRFTLKAATIAMGFEPFDTSGVESLCAQLDIPYSIKHTQIAQILFEQRKEKNPCSLCAKMRRGVLNDLAVELGCNKVALGHHREDVLETLLLSLLHEGRLHTFQPVTYLSRKRITVIRPMIYLPEKHIIHMRAQLNLPVIENPCPANGYTRREDMGKMLDALCKDTPDAKEKMLNALRNVDQYGLWDPKMWGG